MVSLFFLMTMLFFDLFVLYYNHSYTFYFMFTNYDNQCLNKKSTHALIPIRFITLFIR